MRGTRRRAALEQSPNTHNWRWPVPMVDVYASAATFANPHQLARDLAVAVMRWEQVSGLALFRRSTAAFVHQMAPAAISKVDGESDYIRVQVGNSGW
jgi:hypothetical protein